MTTPGGTNVGTAYGKVRIDYESTGVAKATKDVEALQHSMVSAGKGATAAAKQFDRAQGQITHAATAATKALEKGINVTAPISITPGKIDVDTGAIAKAVANFKDIKRQPITIATGVKLLPTKVDVDRGAITKTIESLSRDGVFGRVIKVKAPIEVETDEISLNTASITRAVAGRGLEPITLRAPIIIDPSDVTINQGALTTIQNQVHGAVNAGARQGVPNQAGGGGAGIAGAGALAMAARLGGPVAAAAAPIGALGLVLTKGFSRLQGLDQAAIKLKALGKSSEEIASVSQSALKSVEGTAFGLDEAFNTAANAMSSGVKSGADLDKFLSATASTAALANVSMQDLGMQFADAAVQGKLTGDILQSLYARSIPVIQLIAKEFGVTDAAAQQMVSNGEVSFDRFINAMNQNSEAARVMGDTVGGSFNNLMASVSRVGAILLAPLFGQANGEASTMAEIIQGLTEKLKEFEGFLKENQSTIVTFWEYAAKGGLLFAQHITNVVGWVLEGIGKLIEGIGHVPSAFAGIIEFFGGEGVADNLRKFSDDMTRWGTTIFEAGQGVHNFDQTLDRAWGGVSKWADETRDAANQTGALTAAVEAAAPPMITLAEALEKAGLKANSVHSSLTGTVQQFRDLMEQLERKEGTEALRNALQKLRDEYDNGGRAAESYEEAIENLADQTIDASSKADALIDSLQKLGILPGGGALAEYNEQFEQMTSYARELPDPLGRTGSALRNLDGTINSGEANGRKLLGVIEEARSSLYELASSGEVPAGEAFDRTAEGLRLVLRDYGLVGQEAEDIINKYLSGGQGKAFFEAHFAPGADPKSVVENAFANDPAKLDSILDLMTTKEDILTELLGGPNATLKIPAQLDVSPPSTPLLSTPATSGQVLPAPLPPGETGGAASSTEKPDAELERRSTTATFPGRTVEPEKEGLDLPFEPWNWVKDLLPTLGAGGVQTHLTPTSLEGKTDEEIKEVIGKTSEETQSLLNTIVSDAELQGQSLSEAFAEGINSNSPEVRAAIVELARIAADGLGHSPAKYGPLSGKGWSFYRGQQLTTDYSEGIVSQSNAAQAAVSSMAGAATVPFAQQIETLMKDLTDISNFGKLALDFGKQLGEIAFSGLRMINDLSGGRLFPKQYKVDTGFDPRRGSALGSWNPTRNALPGAPFSTGAPGSPSSGQIPLVQRPDGTWTSSNPEWAKLIERESKGDPKVVQQIQDANSGGNEASGLFQIAKGTWTSNGGERFAPEARFATPQQQAEIAAKIFREQGGGPWGAVPGGGREDEEALRRGLMGGGTTAATTASNVVSGQGLSSSRGGVKPDLFLIHTSESDMGPADLAQWMRAQGDRSYNYLSDLTGSQIITEVDPTKAAWSVGPQGNSRSINAVIAGSKASWTREEWLANASGGIATVARQAAVDAQRFGIPPTFLQPGQQGSGIGGHSWVSDTLGGTDHTDPGEFFPWDVFQAEFNKAFGGGALSGTLNQMVGNAVGGYPGDEAILSRVPAGRYDSSAKNLEKGLADCSSSVEDLVNIMDGMPTEGGTLTTMNAAEELVKRGFLPTDVVVPGAMNIAFNRGHMQATLPGGTNFNWGSDAAAALGGRTSHGAYDEALNQRFYRPVAGGASAALPGSPTNPLSVTNPNFGSLPLIPEGLEQFSDLLSNQPQNASDAERWLQNLDSQISDLNRQPETALRNSQIEALGQQRSSVMSRFGLKEGPNQLDQAQEVFNGVTGIVSSAFETFDAGIKYIGAWKTVSETLVRGISNTEDVMTLIDQWQIGFDFWNKLVQTGSEIASFAGAFTAGSDYGATSAVGGILGMASQIMTAINTGIDLAQEGYRITTKYVGRFLTSWFGFPGATDIKFLLDEMEGQLKIYTSDNPQMKSTFNTLGRSLGAQYPGRPSPTNNFTIYQGPGQDPRDTMDDAMFTVRSSGVGAFGYAD